MNIKIIPVKSSFDARTRSQLLTAMKKKRLVLLKLTITHEKLITELELIKKEYYLRIGKLFSKDNELDTEIIKYKSLLSMINNGATYKAACEAIQEDSMFENIHENSFYEEIHMQKESERENSDISNNLKGLWKKAIMKFHPDLVTDSEEKKKREEIMKKVNKAYAENDYDTLQQLYRSKQTMNIKETTLTDLEQILVEIENMILHIKNEIALLKQTEWYAWKSKIRKAKKTGIDVFKELEETLQDDIARKIHILSKLKKDLHGY